MDCAKENFYTSIKSKRSNKPLMEKKRRERINKSLNRLKELVLAAENKDVSKFNKLEKADILEMAVNHLKSLHEKTKTSSKCGEFLKKYRDGFDLCVLELENYSREMKDLSPECFSAVISHLKHYSEGLKEDSVTLSYRGTSHRVKAAIDSSVLNSEILTHDNYLKSSRVKREISSKRVSELESESTLEICIPSWRSGTIFPPSPPDSARSLSSPESLRSSPKYICDTTAGLETASMYGTIPSPTAMVADSSSLSIPLNLSTSSEESEAHSSHPDVSLIHPSISPSAEPPREISPISASDTYKSNCTSTPTPLASTASTVFGKYASSDEIDCDPSSSLLSSERSKFDPTKRIPHSRFSHAGHRDKFERRALLLDLAALRSKQLNTNSSNSVNPTRSVPYPKKDAVKRYQTQYNSLCSQTQRGFLNNRVRNSEKSHTNRGPPNVCRQIASLANSYHWRPW